ncbi:MAG: type III-A CRISPR-associated protein Csm2 [Roseiflexaceae bacterium]|nr:type III-A CRISPR-associated protein Csm2 [Roseiflexaceae bacterium]
MTEPPRAMISPAEIQKIISDPAEVSLMISCAEWFGKRLVSANLTTTQVRGIFGTVRQIQAEIDAFVSAQSGRVRTATSVPPPVLLPVDVKRKLMMLIPRMAFQARREKDNGKGDGVEQLKVVLDQAIASVVGSEEPHAGGQIGRFRRFVDFFEATLAYHKANGGRDQGVGR